MPIFTPEKLHRIGIDLLVASGVPDDDARCVVDHLVDSNLFGHDSHGVIRYPEYVKAIQTGRFQAKGQIAVLKETPCTAVVDNGGALGQVGATFAMRRAIDKAKTYGTATVSLRNTSHVGRVGAYPLMAAREGLIGFSCVNAGRMGHQIAPFGGIDGRLSTNPIAFAAPRKDADPIMVDMTTSVVAEGKIRVARNQGKQVPEGWLIDGEGKPSRDPNVMYAQPRGAILPMGGVVAHKGFALGIMVEILAGTLSQQGCASGAPAMASNGVMFTVYHPDFFVEREWYENEVETMVRHIKSSRLASGFSEILLPGEPEFRLAQKRRRDGIELDDTTWTQIKEAAVSVGLDSGAWAD
ncbi:MAG: Ldh family oxidoreductase [candidate division Zixibacteria bacterium]|nr:Ldh family oxidoreductase [candidate division Zixibacteria bacterium]